MSNDKEKLTAVKAQTPDVLPHPDFHFAGHIGRTYLDSDRAQFPQPVTTPKGARTFFSSSSMIAASARLSTSPTSCRLLSPARLRR